MIGLLFEPFDPPSRHASFSAIPNRPEADSIAEGETPLIRYTSGDFGAGITEVSSTNHAESELPSLAPGRLAIWKTPWNPRATIQDCNKTNNSESH